jgi:anti-anti-sigma factor
MASETVFTPKGITLSLSECSPDALVLAIGGELDTYSINDFKDFLATAEQSSQKLIVLDLRELTFIDSSGLGAIIGLQIRVRDQQRRLVVCPSFVVSKIFDIGGMAAVLQTAATPEVLFAAELAGNESPAA